MKAWIKQASGLVLGELEEPRQASDEVLVKVEAISVNRGEIRLVARAAEGVVPGWDLAGVVVAAAPNGKGPAKGTRVAAMMGAGGWAERVAVPISRAAVIPAGVGAETASTLPIAGLTMLRAFAVAGSVTARRVLITGGSGGVGQLAIQYGALSGAEVTAISSKPDAAQTLRGLGASEVVPTIDAASGPFELILESVGGSSLASAIAKVARGGVVVSIGNSSEEETTFNARTLYAKGGASVYGLVVFEELESHRIEARDLERLLSLVAAGKVRPWISETRPWTELPAVLRELEARAFPGKAVLTLG